MNRLSIFWILSLVEMLMFGWDFEFSAWLRFWRWILIKICVGTCLNLFELWQCLIRHWPLIVWSPYPCVLDLLQCDNHDYDLHLCCFPSCWLTSYYSSNTYLFFPGWARICMSPYFSSSISLLQYWLRSWQWWWGSISYNIILQLYRSDYGLYCYTAYDF